MSEVQPPKSSLTLRTVSYPVRQSGSCIIDQFSRAYSVDLSLSRDKGAKLSAARISRGSDPTSQTPDVLIDSVFSYKAADAGKEIVLTLSSNSLPLGSEVAVSCPEDESFSIARTKVRDGRIISINVDPPKKDTSLTLQLKFFLLNKPVLKGGSLSFDVSRLTTEDKVSAWEVMRDPTSGLPIGRVSERSTQDVVTRLGLVSWVLQRT